MQGTGALVGGLVAASTSAPVPTMLCMVILAMIVFRAR